MHNIFHIHILGEILWCIMSLLKNFAAVLKKKNCQIASYDAKDAALEAAETQLAYMNGNFCGKHEFPLVEVDDNYVIGMVGGGCGCKH